MRTVTVIGLKFFALFFITSSNAVLQISLDSIKSVQKMKLLIYGVDPVTEQVKHAIEEAANLLSCPLETRTGFNVSVRFGPAIDSIQKMKQFFQEGFSIGIFVSYDHMIGRHVWRLYDTARAEMQGTGIINTDYESGSSRLADEWWRMLVGSQPLFSTFIAFCTETNKQHTLRDLETVPFGGKFSDRTKIVRSKKILMPRWYPDNPPLLFYSEITPFNIRLVSVDRKSGKKRVVVNTKGSSFAPSYCSRGTGLVYCHSRDGESQLCRFNVSGLLPLRFQGHNAVTYLSPTLCDNGDIIFCSDAQGALQVFYYEAAQEHVRQLTFGASAQCPDYCPERNEVVFVRPVNGVLQLFSVSCTTGSVLQLTFDAGSKEECRWSPGGLYIVYAHSVHDTSRIACFNYETRESFFITSAAERCLHPSWSFVVA